jgi:hypothetical protein
MQQACRSGKAAGDVVWLACLAFGFDLAFWLFGFLLFWLFGFLVVLARNWPHSKAPTLYDVFAMKLLVMHALHFFIALIAPK